MRRKPKSRRRIWGWLLLSLFLALCLFGIISYFRVSSFVDTTFGGRNEASLLDTTVSAISGSNPIVPPTSIASGAIVNLPQATPVTPYVVTIPPLPDTTPLEFPSPTPLPVATATATLIPATATPINTPVPATATPIATPVPATVTPIAAPTPTSAPLPAATAIPAGKSSAPIIEKIQRGERVSLLVLGYAGPGHEEDGPYLTDSILQVVYDPVKKKVTMINIPRDLYTLIPYAGPGSGYWGKVNQAFSYVMNLNNSNGLSKRYSFSAGNVNSKLDAAAILTKDVVESITGIPVDHWLAVTFTGFKNLVDAIGGVDVNVEVAFTDNEYLVRDNANNIVALSFNTGPYHLDGKLALAFARSRYSLQDNGDLGRSRRQMKLVAAVKEKALKPDIALKAGSIMDALQGNLRTSLPFNDLVALGNFLNGEDGRSYATNVYFMNRILGYDQLEGTSSPETGFIFMPKAGQGNYGPIREWIKQGLAEPVPKAGA